MANSSANAGSTGGSGQGGAKPAGSMENSYRSPSAVLGPVNAPRLEAWNQILNSSAAIMASYFVAVLIIAGLVFDGNGIFLLFIKNPDGLPATPGAFLDTYILNPVIWSQVACCGFIFIAMLNKEMSVVIERDRRPSSLFYFAWFVSLFPTLAMMYAVAAKTPYLNSPLERADVLAVPSLSWLLTGASDFFHPEWIKTDSIITAALVSTLPLVAAAYALALLLAFLSSRLIIGRSTPVETRSQKALKVWDEEKKDPPHQISFVTFGLLGAFVCCAIDAYTRSLNPEYIEIQLYARILSLLVFFSLSVAYWYESILLYLEHPHIDRTYVTTSTGEKEVSERKVSRTPYIIKAKKQIQHTLFINIAFLALLVVSIVYLAPLFLETLPSDPVKETVARICGYALLFGINITISAVLVVYLKNQSRAVFKFFQRNDLDAKKYSDEKQAAKAPTPKHFIFRSDPRTSRKSEDIFRDDMRYALIGVSIFVICLLSPYSPAYVVDASPTGLALRSSDVSLLDTVAQALSSSVIGTDWNYSWLELLLLFFTFSVASIIILTFQPIERTMIVAGLAAWVAFAGKSTVYRYQVPGLDYSDLVQSGSGYSLTPSFAVAATVFLFALWSAFKYWAREKGWDPHFKYPRLRYLFLAAILLFIAQEQRSPETQSATIRLHSGLADDPCEEEKDGAICRLDPSETLTRWLQATAKEPKTDEKSDPPVLLVMAFSGGGYRATYWSSLVLDSIAARKPDYYERNLRLMTGASGGMIAASYAYALAGTEACPAEQGPPAVLASFLNDVRNGPEGPICAARDRQFFTFLQSSEAKFEHRPPIDSMSILLRGLRRDIWDMFRFSTVADERGLGLEKQWRTLRSTTFADIAERERQGLTPSLIQSPTMISDGRPLYISNLAWRREESSSKTLAPRHLFENFRDSRSKFNLATGARLSATFPVILPVLDLPTKPPIGVADAGYFDNFGVETALDLLLDTELRRSLLQGSLQDAKILLVEVRAFPEVFRRDTQQEDIDRAKLLDENHTGAVAAPRDQRAPECWRGAGSDDPGDDDNYNMRVKEMARTVGFDPLLAPIIGVSNVRKLGMDLRRTRYIDRARKAFGTDRFQHFVLENHSRSSLSWALRPHEMDCMEREIKLERNRIKLELITALMNDASKWPGPTE